MIFSEHVFDDDYSPDTLVHRNQELSALANALGLRQSRHNPDDVLIAGPPGIGKTALVEHLLHEQVSDTTLEWVHVQCLGKSTAEILRSVLRDLTQAPVPSDTPIEHVRAELVQAVTAQTIVVLDDADDVPDTNVLNELTGILHLSIIAICYNPDRWFDRLDDHLQTRFQTVVEPDRYSDPELVDILLARAKQGLARGVFDEMQLRQIAQGSAGVPRYGIQSLRGAAELAIKRDHAAIRQADVSDSFKRARGPVRELTLQSLDYHHHVLYELVRDADEISETELNEQYTEQARRHYRDLPLTPIARQPRRAHLSELERHDLIQRPHGTSAVVYSAVDPALQSPVAATPRPQ